MNRLFTTLKTYFNRVRGLFPEALPHSPAALDAYVARMMATYWLPTNSVTDVAWVTSSAIVHFGPLVSRKPMYFFVLAIRAAGAKQVAGDKFQRIKQEQQAALTNKNEATTLKAVASSEQQK